MSFWSPEPVKLNSSFSRVATHSLPSAPPSRPVFQETLMKWERSAREQTLMCNQAAGFSWCITKVQDPMVAQLKTLQTDMGKGKTSGRSQHAFDELEYLVTFNRSITQAMARTMQDLSEGIFINMANLTLARHYSYLEYICAGVKQDTIVALINALLHLQSLFPDQKMRSHVVKRSILLAVHTGSPVVFTHMFRQLPSHQLDWKSSVPVWKQIRDRQQSKKGRGKGSTFSQKNVLPD